MKCVDIAQGYQRNLPSYIFLEINSLILSQGQPEATVCLSTLSALVSFVISDQRPQSSALLWRVPIVSDRGILASDSSHPWNWSLFQIWYARTWTVSKLPRNHRNETQEIRLSHIHGKYHSIRNGWLFVALGYGLPQKQTQKGTRTLMNYIQRSHLNLVYYYSYSLRRIMIFYEWAEL